MEQEKKDFYWLNEESKIFLTKNEGYLKKGVDPIDRLQIIAENAEKILGVSGFASKFMRYLAKGYYSLSTPVWTNFGNDRGLPVSCFGSYISDELTEILGKVSEIGIMTKYGGGTSGYFGDLRPRGSKIKTSGGESTGVVPFLELYEVASEVITQGNARRGFFAAYLNIDHPDIEEFLKIREDGNSIQNLAIGVTITDDWMQEMKNGDKEKRKIWGKVIKKRYESGFPYISFIDNMNNNAPKAYKDKNLKIKASNLCNEISLFSDKDNSFVCVLSSINLLHWDEIKKTDAVETLTWFLEAVNEEFVKKSSTDKNLKSAYNFSKNHRALGLGVLGWHSYLQSKNIAFESMQAKLLNSEIFSELDKKTLKASQEMAQKYGEPELLKGYGVRNVTRMAIAPTTSSSFILGQVSPSIEPLNSNYFVKNLAKGNFTYKNPYLKEVLKSYEKDNQEVWKSILTRGGSVQHLDFLSENEKNVFKTFGEISQKEIIIQASARQKYIDQGQSLNIMIPPKTPAKEVNQLMIEAWEMGIKGLYYQRGANPSQELSRSILECQSCSG